MKKFLTLIVLTISLATFAQSKLNLIGFEAGPSFSSLRGNQTIKEYHDPRFGCAGGVTVEVILKNNLSLKSGIGYERKGSSIKLPWINDIGVPVGTVYIKENFDYLGIPVLLRAGFGKESRFFFNVGPSFNFLLKQTEHYDAIDDFPEQNNDNTESFSMFELALSAGIGTVIPVNKKFSFSCELRDNLGLTNIGKEKAADGGGIKTNAVNLLIGVSYKVEQ
jgi:hypothetical protein